MLTYASSALLATAYASRLCSSPPSRRCPISVPLHTFFYILKKNYIKKKNQWLAALQLHRCPM
jgi:hypothetical protein